jgi:hypothetical protein
MGDTFAVGANVDISDIQLALEVGLNEWPKATAKALNSVTRKARTRAVNRISDELNIQPRELVEKRMKMGKARADRLFASLRFLVKPISAIRLAGVIDTGDFGVVVPGHQELSHSDAFIARARGRFGTGSHLPQVFRRKGKARIPLEAVKLVIAPRARMIIEAEAERAGDELFAALPDTIMEQINKARKADNEARAADYEKTMEEWS